MAVQTYGALTNLQRNAYNMVLLKRLIPYIPMFREGERASIARNQGTTMEWRIFNSLALATSALTEGTPPSDTALSVSKVTKAVSQYGAWVKLSDLLVHQGIDPVWAETFELLGEQAGQSLHTVLINELAAGTNVQYASTATSRVTVAAGMNLNSTEIREAVRALKRAKVPRHPDGYYHALIHPDASYDLQSDALWQDVAKYNGGVAAGGGPNILTGEIGRIHGVRFMESTDAPFFDNAGAASIDVFGTLIYGPRWYGIIDLAAQPTPAIDAESNRGVKVYGVPVETPTKDDPLGQFGTAGWKVGFAAKILQEARGIRVEHAATA